MEHSHAPIGIRGQAGHFVRHYAEMCLAMCAGFAIGDAVYFWVVRGFGFDDPFAQLPELSVLVVCFNMTAPMAAWMLFRGMDRTRTIEMSVAMVVWAVALLAVGWLGLLPRSELAVTEHALMMPAMLVPMIWRLDYYTGRGGQMVHAPSGARAA